MPKEDLTDEQRKSPVVEGIDEKTKTYLKNMGYSNVEVPPGMNVGQVPVDMPAVDRDAPIADDAVVNEVVSLAGDTTPQVIPPTEPERKPGIKYAVDEEKKRKEAQLKLDNQGNEDKTVVDSGSPVVDDKPKQDNQDTGGDKKVQAMLDKVKAEKDKELLQSNEQVKTLQTQVQTMMAMMQGQVNNPQPEGTPKVAPKSPELKNFTKDLGDDWDSSEILDSRTKSGIAYAAFQDARDEWLLEKAETGAEARLTNKQQNQLVMEKATAFAAQHSEYQNFDGTPNVQKIQAFFESVKNGDWTKLKAAMDVVAKGDAVMRKTPQSNPNYPVVESADIQINQAANKTNVQAIGNAGAPGGDVTPKEDPSAVKQLKRLYGPNFEIPKGAVIID